MEKGSGIKSLKLKCITVVLLLFATALGVCAKEVSHTIGAGETFKSISKRYGISEDRLKSCNPKVAECIEGIILTIPDPRNSSQGLKTEPQEYKIWKGNKNSSDNKKVKAAVESLKKASETGYIEAQYDYACQLLSGGKGIKKDEVKAIGMLCDLAAKGYAIAKWEIYDVYNHRCSKKLRNSKHFPRKEILEIWYNESVEAGVVKAMASKARDYATGNNGVEIDSVISVDLYCSILTSTKSQNNDLEIEEARNNLHNMRHFLKGNSNALLKKATQYEKSGNVELANIYYLRSSELGNVKSMVKLADNYSEGNGTKMNKEEAAKWYAKAGRKDKVKAINGRDKQNINKNTATTAKSEVKPKTTASSKTTVSAKTSKTAKKSQESSNKKAPSNKKAKAKVNPKDKPQNGKRKFWDKFMDTLDKVGQALTAVNQTLDVINGVVHPNSSSVTERKSYNEQPSKRSPSDEEEVRYIPELLNEIQGEIDKYQSFIDEYEDACEKTKRAKRTKLTNWCGTLTEVPDLERSKTYKSRHNGSEVSSDKKVISMLEARKNFVRNYGILNKTDYIPKAAYDNMMHRQSEGEQKAREARKKGRKMLNDNKTRGYYLDYESQLKRHSASPNGRDLKWIRNVQDKMKKLRKESGCSKSPWEDWDGVHDPD